MRRIEQPGFDGLHWHAESIQAWCFLSIFADFGVWYWGFGGFGVLGFGNLRFEVLSGILGLRVRGSGIWSLGPVLCSPL